MSALHCALEIGADLYVNECQKVRHYRARSTEERRRRRRRKKKKKKKNAKSRCFTSRGAYVKLRYIAMLYCTLIRLEISHRTRWWCLKCVIVHLARDIPAFVMYCVYGASHSSLLIESTDSMIPTALYSTLKPRLHKVALAAKHIL